MYAAIFIAICWFYIVFSVYVRNSQTELCCSVARKILVIWSGYIIAPLPERYWSHKIHEENCSWNIYAENTHADVRLQCTKPIWLCVQPMTILNVNPNVCGAKTKAGEDLSNNCRHAPPRKREKKYYLITHFWAKSRFWRTVAIPASPN